MAAAVVAGTERSRGLAFMSKFGTWFLRRPEGHVEMLDVSTGEVPW
jgi:hypothetical protein